MISPIKFTENVGLIIETRDQHVLMVSNNDKYSFPTIEHTDWRWKDNRKKILVDNMFSVFGIKLLSQNLKLFWQGRKGISLFRYKGDELDSKIKINSIMLGKVVWVLINDLSSKREKSFTPISLIYREKYLRIQPNKIEVNPMRKYSLY